MNYAQLFTPLAGLATHPTWDTVVFFTVFAVGLFYGLSVGRRRIVSSIMYAYVSLALLAVVPVERLAGILGVRELWRARIGAFVIIFALLFFLLGRGRLFGFPSAKRWWQSVVLTLLGAGLFIRILVGFLPDAMQSGLVPFIQRLFVRPDLALWWYGLPLVALVFIRWVEGREE